VKHFGSIIHRMMTFCNYIYKCCLSHFYLVSPWTGHGIWPGFEFGRPLHFIPERCIVVKKVSDK
jgi:hypothetical protein